MRVNFMNSSIGVDIVDKRRIGELLQKFGDKLPLRVLGADELTVFEQRSDQTEFLAGRFAAKEALIKALGGLLEQRPPYNEIQILPDQSGQPVVRFTSGSAALEGYSFQVSISHEKNYAVAMALGQREE